MDVLSASTMDHDVASPIIARGGVVHIGDLLGGSVSVIGSIGQCLSNKEMTNRMELKPYMKVCLKGGCAVCAIYEPHPFRADALPGDLNIGISNDKWCWVFYDWCGNPVGIMESCDGMPEGEVVSAFTAEDIGSQDLADYLNIEQPEFVEAWNRRMNDAKVDA